LNENWKNCENLYIAEWEGQELYCCKATIINDCMAFCDSLRMHGECPKFNPPIVVDIHKKFGNTYDIYIGRALNYPNATFPKSIWANPYSFKKYGKKSLDLYEQYIRKKVKENPEKYDILSLSGKVLGCWCKQTLPGGICHGDILVKLFQERISWKYTVKRTVEE